MIIEVKFELIINKQLKMPICCDSASCSIKSFFARFFSVAILLKSGLDIVLLNKDTPQLLVARTTHWLREVNHYVYVDQDPVLRFTMKNQQMISLVYGSLILFLSTMVVLNMCKCFAKCLIGLILASIVFFYVECNAPYLVNETKLEDMLTLIGIVAALFLVSGYTEV